MLAFSVRRDDELTSESECEIIEKDLTLVGITAVEDLLQDDVAKCIQDFRLAGIKVWMLTGDKGETALEIGQRCGLYDCQKMKLIQVAEEVEDRLLYDSLTEAQRQVSEAEEGSKFAMAVAGKSLPVIYNNIALRECINYLFANSAAVIVYRSSPAQKAETVKYIRKHLGGGFFNRMTTMAIGDGANDVNMI